MSTSRSGFPGAQFVIYPATPDDSAALSRIAQLAKASWGYSKAWLDAWRDELTITSAYISSHLVFIARQGAPLAPPLGFSALSFPKPDSAELDHLWVLPDQQGRGLGRLLFIHAAAHARIRHARRLLILSDPNAVAFYTHLGAIPLDVHTYQLFGETRILPRLIYSL